MYVSLNLLLITKTAANPKSDKIWCDKLYECPCNFLPLNYVVIFYIALKLIQFYRKLPPNLLTGCDFSLKYLLMQSRQETEQFTASGRTDCTVNLWRSDCCMLAGLERHQRLGCCSCEQKLPWCWTEEAALWISQQLGLLLLHIAVWFCVLHCVAVGSTYWR